MFKRRMAAPMAAILALVIVTPVFAGGPSRDPVPGAILNFAAGDVCSFPVTMVVEGKVSVLTFEASELYTGLGTVTVTNDWTTEWVYANISGPAKYVYNADGSIAILGGGPWLIFNFANDPLGAGMWLTAGRVLAEIAADGTMTSITLLGHSRDVCELLG